MRINDYIDYDKLRLQIIDTMKITDGKLVSKLAGAPNVMIVIMYKLCAFEPLHVTDFNSSHKTIYEFIKFSQDFTLPTFNEYFYKFYATFQGYQIDDIEYTYLNYLYNNDFADWQLITKNYNDLESFYRKVMEIDHIKNDINETIKFAKFYVEVINPQITDQRRPNAHGPPAYPYSDFQLVNPWKNLELSVQPPYQFRAYKLPYVNIFGQKIGEEDLYRRLPTSNEFEFNDGDKLYASVATINKRVAKQAPAVFKCLNDIASKIAQFVNVTSNVITTDAANDFTKMTYVKDGVRYFSIVLAGGFVSELIKDNYINVKSSDCDVFVLNHDENTYTELLNKFAVMNENKNIIYSYFGSVVTTYLDDEPRPYQFMSCNAHNLYDILDWFDYSHIHWGMHIEVLNQPDIDGNFIRFHPVGHYSAHMAMESRITEIRRTYNVKVNRFIKPLARGYDVYKSATFIAASQKINPNDVYRSLSTPEGLKMIREFSSYYVSTSDLEFNIRTVERMNPTTTVTIYLKTVLSKLTFNGKFNSDYEMKLIDNIDITSGLQMRLNCTIKHQNHVLQVYTDYLELSSFSSDDDYFALKLVTNASLKKFLDQLQVYVIAEHTTKKIKSIYTDLANSIINVKFPIHASKCTSRYGTDLDPEFSIKNGSKICAVITFALLGGNKEEVKYEIKTNSIKIITAEEIIEEKMIADAAKNASIVPTAVTTAVTTNNVPQTPYEETVISYDNEEY